MKRALLEQNVVVVEEKGVKTKRPTFITGFLGPGYVGSTASSHLIVNLGMREIAHVESRLIPPMKSIVGGEFRPVHPLRIYMSPRGDLLTLKEEGLGAISSSAFWDIAEALVNWLREKGTRMVILLEGVPVRVEAEPTLFAYCTDHQKVEELRQNGIEPLLDGFMSGIGAGIIDGCIARDIPWLMLLTTTTRLMEATDFQASAKIVDALNNILGIKIDTQSLLELGKNTREQREKKGVIRSFKKFLIGE